MADPFQVPTYFIPLYFQFVRGSSPLTAAVGLLLFIFLMVTFGFLNGALMSKLGYYMPWYLAGGILTTIGGALMSTHDIFPRPTSLN
jgi:pheromone shutdown protein TraB